MFESRPIVIRLLHEVNDWHEGANHLVPCSVRFSTFLSEGLVLK